MDKRTGVVTMGGNPMTLVGKEIKVGDRAPDFTGLKGDMSSFSLKDAGDKKKIISVVTSLDTGICELQTTRFNEEASELKDVVIITISVDLPFAQKRFCSAHDIDKVITVSDIFLYISGFSLRMQDSRSPWRSPWSSINGSISSSFTASFHAVSMAFSASA